ncbi:MAG: glycosyltransferase [Lachnospiraceae bacterium]|nr:glycosyltransferase [Lachnospiraceae bacterium]
MKILQISAFSGWGCTGRIVYGIDRALVSEGQESVVAWGRTNTAPDEVKTLRIGTDFDQNMHGLYTRLTDHCGFGSKGATKRFLKEVDVIRPDLIHLQIMHGYYINLELLFAYIKKKEIPVVWTFHDGWAFTGHCPCYCYNTCNKWKTHCEKCERRKFHPESWFFDRSYENFDRKKAAFTGVKNMTIVTPSKWFAGKVRESFFKEYPVEVIHNGINTEDFYPRENARKRVEEKYSSLKGQKIVLGVSSTWTEQKGIKDFAKLSEILPEGYKIVMVGLLEEQMKELPDRIVKIAHTDSVQELAELYTAADVFINATYEDNYPTCNLEAIACGTPVITYEIDGSVESVQESGMGQLVPLGDVKGLKDAVLTVTAKDDWKNQGLIFDQQECYKEYVNLYKRILR